MRVARAGPSVERIGSQLYFDGRGIMETRHRTLKHQVRRIAFAALFAAFAAAVVTASLALADSGTQNAGMRSAGFAVWRSSPTDLTPRMSVIHRAWTEIKGEAKSEQPFTDPASITDGLARFLHNSQARTTGPSGEPKNEPPFTTNIGGGNSPTAQAFGWSYGTRPS
jgi:hypothetical protein